LSRVESECNGRKSEIGRERRLERRRGEKMAMRTWRQEQGRKREAEAGARAEADFC
jgi:hypothetical protein